MAQYPNVGGGTQVDDEFLAALIDNYVIKAADAPGRTVAVASGDPDLLFPVVANAVYDVTFHIRFGGLQAAGLRTAWLVPAGTTGTRDVMGPGSVNAVEANANTTEMRWSTYAYASAAGYTNPRNSLTSLTWCEERALLAIGGTAGNVQLSWAQLTANATGTVVSANSYVKYRRIA